MNTAEPRSRFREPGGSEERGVLLPLLALAVSLAAVAAAALTAWHRCGRGDGCSAELGLAVLAFAPASVIGLVMLFLLRVRGGGRRVRAVILGGGVGLASTPLAAFLLQDLRLLPLFVGLLAAALMLAFRSEDEEEETAAAGRAASGSTGPPGEPYRAGPPPAAGSRQATTRDPLMIVALLDGLAESTRDLAALVDLLEKRGTRLGRR